MFFNRNKESMDLDRFNKYYGTYINGMSYYLDGDYYLCKNGTLLKFYTERCFDTWRLDPLDISLNKHMRTYGGVLGFRDGTLIQNAKDGRIYMISDSRKRLLTHPLEDYRFEWADVLAVSDAETNIHMDGEELSG